MAEIYRRDEKPKKKLKYTDDMPHGVSRLRKMESRVLPKVKQKKYKKLKTKTKKQKPWVGLKISEAEYKKMVKKSPGRPIRKIDQRNLNTLDSLLKMSKTEEEWERRIDSGDYEKRVEKMLGHSKRWERAEGKKKKLKTKY